jgi:hypothetical protein
MKLRAIKRATSRAMERKPTPRPAWFWPSTGLHRHDAAMRARRRYGKPLTLGALRAIRARLLDEAADNATLASILKESPQMGGLQNMLLALNGVRRG